jgi:hypothetical protein
MLIQLALLVPVQEHDPDAATVTESLATAPDEL